MKVTNFIQIQIEQPQDFCRNGDNWVETESKTGQLFISVFSIFGVLSTSQEFHYILPPTCQIRNFLIYLKIETGVSEMGVSETYLSIKVIHE